ncbi:NADP-dependent malic enzyme [Cryomorpha ignava]|uniref:NADP-dependent malic enzyme n=1 Tax=Cryomorpha ignava TaxID=101383 RepID=A0A7K3WQ58_9FLAO|nr:NADP-dependent malic enzyme [Cryomorpha ignava]NEN23022.1 NADP-dependent malic enzyme [Cryomorpha ignava]
MTQKKSTGLRKKDILEYHENDRPGKIEVIPTKPSNSQRDLSIAYSPGVAEPCKEIQNDPEAAYRYTAKANLVAVISNGTAVLGLGDIGALASKPVMEGKGVLFKIFADIDVFDLELDTTDVEKFIQTVKIVAPTFGGINLEDIKAPECFEIERRLRDELDIPVMHDDQHGTAIITGAALLNALDLAEKKIGDVKVVFNGAGASAISCATLYISLGVNPKNLFMLDSKGVITTRRENLNKEKEKFAQDTDIETLAEMIKDADVFVGLSKGGVVNQKMVKSMAPNPIVFALANPDPEISYKDATAARKDIIMATGRSDNPNMVNNVLGFPYIFRGALDVRATSINEEMKLAAVKAIADLARETVPEVVNLAYNRRDLSFGKEYIIPKPFDPRLIITVAPAVAKAAMESGVARRPIRNWKNYEDHLITKLGRDDKFIRVVMEKAKSDPQRIVFADGETYKVLKAAQILADDGIAKPIVLGRRNKIDELVEKYALSLEGIEIEDINEHPETVAEFTDIYYEARKRSGATEYEARKNMITRGYYGSMMVKTGKADVLLTGLALKYPSAIKPIFEIIGRKAGVNKAAGVYIILTKDGPLFLADTTINTDPSVEDIVEIVENTAEAIRKLGLIPKIAILSYSNFGSNKGRIPDRMEAATKLVRKKYPDLIVDGEMQANFAMNNKLLEEMFPFSTLVGNKPNALIFPDLASGNIAYKLLQSYGSAEAIGPLLVGLDKSAHVLQMGSGVREIVNMASIAAVDAQQRKNGKG